MSQPIYSRIELGLRTASSKEAERIAAALDADVAALGIVIEDEQAQVPA